MNKILISKISYVIIGLLFLALGLFGISRLHLHSALPLQLEKKGSDIIIADIMPKKNSALLRGDRLVKIDGLPIQTGREVDFVLDNSLPGDTVALVVQRGEEIFSISQSIISRFTRRFIIINLLLGLLFWIAGAFVYLNRPFDRAARIFFWGAMTLSASILCNWPGYPFDIGFLGYFQPILFLIVYPLVPVFILYFTMIYPTEQRITLDHKYLPIIMFILCLVFIILLEASYLSAFFFKSISHYVRYIDFYNSFRVYLILCLAVGLGLFIHSYRYADTRENRDKIRWILWGMAVGAFPFIFLWTMPIVAGISPLIPEELNYIFLMAVPLAFGFSIVKYQALDIEIVINRSIVYVIVTGIVIGFYLTLAGVTGHFLQAVSPKTGSILTIIFTLVAAAVFAPVKNRIQTFVDKTFYRIKYNYRLALKDFGDAIISAHDKNQLTNLIITKLNNSIPVEKIILLLPGVGEERYLVGASEGVSKDDLFELCCGLREGITNQLEKFRTVLVKPGRAELTDFPHLPGTPEFDRLGLELVIPIMLENDLLGLLVIGKKKSGMRYSDEDIELLTSITNQGLLALERLKTQEAIILERAEKEKLKELSELKSEFVSHVSHELRTPLTSIQWSIENLLDGIPEPPTPKIRGYLEGVHDSSQHLGRMIENLLDVSRIEAGRIEIFLERLDIEDEVKKVLDMMKPLAEKKNIRFKMAQSESLWVKADRDRLRDILTNILDNAIKYSNDGDEVEIKIEQKIDTKKLSGEANEMASISVIDHGAGIPEEKQRAIFERFERIRAAKATRQKGLGLGLYIVKKLVELQGGRIWVESEVGKGSAFIFILPGGRIN